MTIIGTIFHTGRQQPWGYEVPATFTDDTGGEHNVVLLFRKQEIPSQVEIDAMAVWWITKLEAAAEEVEIEPEI